MSHEITILLAYFALWALVMLLNVNYRCLGLMVRKTQALPAPSADQLPPMSIIVTACEQHNELRRNLPLMLEQEYSASYEVIVVDMNSTDDTPSLLEAMQDRYPHLHVVSVPDSARSISPTRLALTLGIRSANYDWTVLTQANCRPASVRWLTRLGQACTQKPETQIVMGYTSFRNGRRWNGLRCRFFRTWQQMLHLPYANRYGAYRCDATNLCYRRSLFLSHRGFADHSNLLVGATDIMVNHHSRPANTALCLHPDAFVWQQSPFHSRWWHQERLFFMETRRHFRRRHLYRLCYFRHVLQTVLFTLCTLAAVLYSLWKSVYWLLAFVAILWLAHTICRAKCFNFTTRTLGERSFTLSLPLLLNLVPLWDIAARLRWSLTKEKTFQKKFI